MPAQQYVGERFVDYYGVLGDLPPTASTAQITQRWHHLREAAASNTSDRIATAVGRFSESTGRPSPQESRLAALDAAHRVLTRDRPAYDSARRQMLSRATPGVDFGGR